MCAFRARNNLFACDRMHFERLIFPWTDPTLGNCSYLDTCRHMKTCRYVHYQLARDDEPGQSEAGGPSTAAAARNRPPVPSYLQVRHLVSKSMHLWTFAGLVQGVRPGSQYCWTGLCLNAASSLASKCLMATSKRIPKGSASALSMPSAFVNINGATLQALPEPQWLKIDVRTFDMTVLGKFGVIMADPPWEIHQDLPYGTMADDEMRKMNIGVLQDDGVIFLWVTGEHCLSA